MSVVLLKVGSDGVHINLLGKPVSGLLGVPAVEELLQIAFKPISLAPQTSHHFICFSFYVHIRGHSCVVLILLPSSFCRNKMIPKIFQELVQDRITHCNKVFNLCRTRENLNGIYVVRDFIIKVPTVTEDILRVGKSYTFGCRRLLL